jgi:hypothetical protein
VPYRDATFSRPDFVLQLIDCWRGLKKGMERRWVCFARSDFMWSKIDVDEYRHYDDPPNGDLQEMVPGNLVAFNFERARCHARRLRLPRRREGRVLQPRLLR